MSLFINIMALPSLKEKEKEKEKEKGQEQVIEVCDSVIIKSS